MTDNELLLAISNMMDKKLKSELQPLKNDIQSMKKDITSMKNKIQSIENDILSMKNDILSLDNKIHQVKLYQENVITPRLDTIESCYTDTFDRYKNSADKMETVYDDVGLLKKVVTKHSEMLQQLA